MSITKERITELEKICNDLRIDLIKMLHDKQTGHPGGSLSVCEILVTLMYEKAKLDPTNPAWEERDRIIMTKGHAAPMQYLILGKLGFFPEEEFASFRQINSILQGHPCMNSTPGIELTSGPLGIGLPAAVGVACSLKLDKNDSYVYAILGDGELNEGAVWEAMMSASKFKTDNLICILDNNGVQLDGTRDEIMPLDNLRERFESFGMKVFEADGHDIADLCDKIDEAKTVKDQPVMIMANTVKGKGVSFMEGKSAWHGNPIGDDFYEQALKELGGK
ncbi:MAG TPA: transketolase [Clostridiaceae bacterium]|nr:transketolase [Clostridiaceae bacterium]